MVDLASIALATKSSQFNGLEPLLANASMGTSGFLTHSPPSFAHSSACSHLIDLGTSDSNGGHKGGGNVG